MNEQTMNDPELPTERTAAIVWLLVGGARLRTVDIARLLGIDWKSAYAMMERISRVTPVAQVERRWQVTSKYPVERDIP
jgi:Mn-dependent DtxR family transcriptional regulator